MTKIDTHEQTLIRKFQAEVRSTVLDATGEQIDTDQLCQDVWDRYEKSPRSELYHDVFRTLREGNHVPGNVWGGLLGKWAQILNADAMASTRAKHAQEMRTTGTASTLSTSPATPSPETPLSAFRHAIQKIVLELTHETLDTNEACSAIWGEWIAAPWEITHLYKLRADLMTSRVPIQAVDALITEWRPRLEAFAREAQGRRQGGSSARGPLHPVAPRKPAPPPVASPSRDTQVGPPPSRPIAPIISAANGNAVDRFKSYIEFVNKDRDGRMRIAMRQTAMADAPNIGFENYRNGSITALAKIHRQQQHAQSVSAIVHHPGADFDESFLKPLLSVFTKRNIPAFVILHEEMVPMEHLERVYGDTQTPCALFVRIDSNAAPDTDLVTFLKKRFFRARSRHLIVVSESAGYAPEIVGAKRLAPFFRQILSGVRPPVNAICLNPKELNRRQIGQLLFGLGIWNQPTQMGKIQQIIDAIDAQLPLFPRDARQLKERMIGVKSTVELDEAIGAFGREREERFTQMHAKQMDTKKIKALGTILFHHQSPWLRERIKRTGIQTGKRLDEFERFSITIDNPASSPNNTDNGSASPRSNGGNVTSNGTAGQSARAVTPLVVETAPTTANIDIAPSDPMALGGSVFVDDSFEAGTLECPPPALAGGINFIRL